MTSIRRLSDAVIMNIAAGQVVDKPVSVVKELLENALDAEATRISVHIQGGGYESIEVLDDGIGMNKEDVEMSYQPHTTSKIDAFDDLLALTTHGFRGEALASIAAVGYLTVASRQVSSAGGWKVEIDKGKCIFSEPCGMPVGTRVEVRDLFKDMPVRKGKQSSYVKSAHEILDCVIRFALIYPNIEFDLIHDTKRLLHTKAVLSLSNRISHLFGSKYGEDILPVDFSDTGYVLKGYIGKPVVAGFQQHTYISINNRAVRDPEIIRSIKNAYGMLLAQRQSPFVVMNISIPQEYVDVNIDPQKYRVQLHNAAQVYDGVTKYIQQLLESHSLIQQPIAKRYTVKMDDQMKELLRDEMDLWTPEKLSHTRFLQIDRCYLIWENQKCLYLADQHAVHERILYEQIHQSFYELLAKKKTHTLPKSYALDLSLYDEHLISEYLSALEYMGFSLKMVGTVWNIQKVPVFLKDRPLNDLIPELLAEMNMALTDDTSHAQVLDHVTHATITYMACRSAIKAGDFVSEEEAQSLITKLFECDKPYSCPHGRPTIQKISHADLEHMFQRS